MGFSNKILAAVLSQEQLVGLNKMYDHLPNLSGENFLDGLQGFSLDTAHGHLNFTKPFENLSDFAWTLASPVYFPLVNSYLALSFAIASIIAFLSATVCLLVAFGAYLFGHQQCASEYTQKASDAFWGWLLLTFTGYVTCVLADITPYTDTVRIVTRSVATAVSFFGDGKELDAQQTFKYAKDVIVENVGSVLSKGSEVLAGLKPTM